MCLLHFGIFIVHEVGHKENLVLILLQNGVDILRLTSTYKHTQKKDMIN